MKTILNLLLLISVTINSLSAQYREFSLQEKVNNSDVILEGKVVDQYTYKKNDLIYTASKLQLCEVIYNKNLSRNANTVIFVITYGGTLNGEFNTWSHMLQLNKNLEGMFFLKKDTSVSPINIGIDSNYYLAYGQEQGFISYSKNENWDFEANSLLSTSTTVDPLIAQINNITSQNSMQNSCILSAKSGLVFQIDSIYPDNPNLSVLTSLKGQWGKNYDLENLTIRLGFSSPVQLANLGLNITPRTNIISNNYTSSFAQIDSNNIEVQLTLNPNAIQTASVNNNFDAFLKFSISNAIVFSTLSSVKLTNASYRIGSHSRSFIDFDFTNNHFMSEFFGAPDMKSFSPGEVCAGIKMDESLGNPAKDGYVIIEGTGFDNVANDKFNTQMPNKYRVEFVREFDLNNDSHKIIPLPEDYEYWTDTEIKVRVPTAGWHLDNGDFDGPKSGVAVTGKINVVTPGGSDSNPQNQTKKDLTIRFAQFNSINDNYPKKSLPNKLFDLFGNGGYYFIFDQSFDDLYPSDILAAKQDVVDAFCEWNSITGIKLEIVETCPVSKCFKIKYDYIPLSGSNSMIALGLGASNFGQLQCPGEAIVGTMTLTLNNEITDWKPSSDADPLLDPHIIKPTVFHEVGHLLQLGHCYNYNTTMYPLYKNTITVDNDAIAGGTHVSEVSAMSSCTKHLIPGIIESCITPLNDIDHHKEARIVIRPNPAKDKIQIFAGEVGSIKMVQIINIDGTRVLENTVTSADNTVEIKSLHNGIYVLRVYTQTQVYTSKFVKYE